MLEATVKASALANTPGIVVLAAVGEGLSHSLSRQPAVLPGDSGMSACIEEDFPDRDPQISMVDEKSRNYRDKADR